jgi:predicted Zn-dependent protease
MSAASRRLILGSAALVALACGEIASPQRTDLYDWRLFVPGANGATDTLSFFWSQSRLPVRIWAEDAAGLPGYAERAIGVWESGFLYREFRGEVVSDSSTADVLIFANSAPNLTLGVHRLHSMAPECSGATDLEVSDDHTQLLTPIRIFIDPVLPEDQPATQTCLALTTVHEMGHALGIFRHSPNPDDIMFADPVVEAPSDLDRGTIEALYHYPPNLEAVRP